MAIDNVNGKDVTEEQKNNARYEELNKIPEAERTDEQKQELGELKEKYGQKMQKKIDKMTAEKRAVEEENERLKRENEELKKKTEEGEEEPAPEGGEEEVVEIAGKKYFTDAALIAQVKAKRMTETEAYNYQRKRDKAEIKAEVKADLAEEDRKKREIDIRKEDADSVLRVYPHFDKKHPDHNPEDPLYKLANELYREGYAANPKGLSLAIKRAKEILRISDEGIDTGGDHEVEHGGPPERPKKEKEVFLTENEKEIAVKQFTRGDIMNPKTGRAYTVNEALAKALAAKKERLGAR